MRRRGRGLRAVYESLHAAYGDQHWWPGDSRFEIMVGAVLTQNAAWVNVERAVANLKRAGALTAGAVVSAPSRRLANWLRPSGYFNVKAKRLRNLCHWLTGRGGIAAVARMSTVELRRELLAVNGVGPETADDIVLYAFERPVFVIDAYTRRLFARMGWIRGDEGYETLRHWFEGSLGPDVRLFNEFHALIVHHAKYVCRTQPRCAVCVLRRRCGYRRAMLS